MILGSPHEIFCLSETWLHEQSTMDSFLSIPNFSFFRRDRPTRNGGGLLVYVSDDLCTVVKRRPDLEDASIECLTIELLDPKHVIFFAYRPPDQSPASFFDAMRALLSAAESEFATLTVLGDLNAKHSSWQSEGPYNPAGTRLFELLLDFGLTQCVHSPTRFTPQIARSCSPRLISVTQFRIIAWSRHTSTLNDAWRIVDFQQRLRLLSVLTSGTLTGTTSVLTFSKRQFCKLFKGPKTSIAP